MTTRNNPYSKGYDDYTAGKPCKTPAGWHNASQYLKGYLNAQEAQPAVNQQPTT